MVKIIRTFVKRTCRQNWCWIRHGLFPFCLSTVLFSSSSISVPCLCWCVDGFCSHSVMKNCAGWVIKPVKKYRPRNDPYYVEWDVKPQSTNQPTCVPFLTYLKNWGSCITVRLNLSVIFGEHLTPFSINVGHPSVYTVCHIPAAWWIFAIRCRLMTVVDVM